MRRKRCDNCGQLQADAKRMLDPYDLDVNNKEVWVTLCAACAQDRADDI